MPSFDTFTCEQCGSSFKALRSSNAAVGGYCSPACETIGKGLD